MSFLFATPLKWLHNHRKSRLQQLLDRIRQDCYEHILIILVWVVVFIFVCVYSSVCATLSSTSAASAQLPRTHPPKRSQTPGTTRNTTTLHNTQAQTPANAKRSHIHPYPSCHTIGDPIVPLPPHSVLVVRVLVCVNGRVLHLCLTVPEGSLLDSPSSTRRIIVIRRKKLSSTRWSFVRVSLL